MTLVTQAFAAAGMAAGLAVAGLARTAWRARWKGGSALTLGLYALHAHVQQIPIGWGQLQWARTHRRGTARTLIDYKRGTP